MTRVGAIDCGTNSIRLLIADVNGDVLTDVVRRLEIVRLGQDVDRTGVFAPAALARTFDACERYARLLAEHGAEVVRFCATSAARDVSNRSDFASGVRLRLGVTPEIISGDDEARLSYAGAIADLPASQGSSHDPRNLVVDIGGGSTELVEGDPAEATSWQSLDIGSVRLTERHLHGDPPLAVEVAAAGADADAELDRLLLDLTAPRRLVGVAGTVTTVAAHALGLTGYDSALIHHAHLPISSVLHSCNVLTAASVAERRAMPFMHPGRADVIGGGAIVLRHALRRFRAAATQDVLLVSEHDILDGIAWSAVLR